MKFAVTPYLWANLPPLLLTSKLSFFFQLYAELQLISFTSFVGKMGTKVSSQFVQLLREDEMAFDNLFCMAFQMLDAQWLTRQASYMEFNVCSL